MNKDFSDFEGNIYDCLEATLNTLGIDSNIQFAGEVNDQHGDTIYISVLGMNQVGQRITGARVQGSDESVNGKNYKFITRQYQADIQLSVLGSGSFVNSSRLHSNIRSRDDIISVWWQHSIPLLNVTNLRRSPQLHETKWVDGYSFDVKVNFMIHENYEVNPIDKVKWVTSLEGVDIVEQDIDWDSEDPNEGLILFGFDGEDDTLGSSERNPDGSVEGGGIYKTLPRTKFKTNK